MLRLTIVAAGRRSAGPSRACRRSGGRPGPREAAIVRSTRSRGAREVAGLVEPDRVRVGGVVEPQPLARRGSSAGRRRPRSRPPTARAPRPRRCPRRGSARRGGRGPRSARPRVRPSSDSAVLATYGGATTVSLEAELVASDEGGHQLGRRGHRVGARRAPLGEHLAVAGVDQRPRRGRAARRRLGRGRGRGGRQRDARAPRRAPRPAPDRASQPSASALHPSKRRSTQEPTWISCGSRFSLSRSSRSIGMQVRSATMLRSSPTSIT